MSDQASTVINLPLSVVESNIWDPGSWPGFMDLLDRVERKSTERFILGVREGRRVFEVPVALRWHPREHRASWSELQGPEFRGEIRLVALNGRRTKVTLEMVARPRTLAGILTEKLVGHRREVDVYLLRLAARLSSIPQPFNPVRQGAARRIDRSRARTSASPAAVPSPEPVAPELVDAQQSCPD
ncbi:MAG: hypothetical protein QG622_286 [Actinomycetota bacterium]|nr:hypothetical protein [Actinomycetota bacterium]